jgi:3-hydroxybutyryl-CoA dehydrogenase
MKTIAVIGAGLMGHGIAQVFALNGLAVRLTDLKPEILSAALQNVRANLDLLADHEIITGAEIEPSLARITTTTDMATAAAGADLVIEAVLEDLPLKQKLFKELDALCPVETILATNTSVISISEIAADTVHPKRVVGTHFWNPPYLIPLVEVIRGKHTEDETMDRTVALLARIGKHPVRVNKDVPGFVGNRLQHALWREAISIVEKGIADAATVDDCVKYGFGLRLPVLGPMENADLVGTDLALAIHDYILEHLESSPQASPLLKAKVAQGHLGFKSGNGFQSWSADAIADTHKRLKTYLLKVTART